MRTLAIDTTSEACSVALFEGPEMDVIGSGHETIGRGHAERLVPMIADLPENGRANRILVSLGPGSFTGVRIGIAAAHALGVAWDCEVLGFPTLALLAAQATAESPQATTICTHGGHGQWFIQNFNADLQPEDSPASLRPEDACNFGRHDLLAGNRADQLAQLITRPTRAMDMLPLATSARRLPAALLSAQLAPYYGRAPDAKPSR